MINGDVFSIGQLKKNLNNIIENSNYHDFKFYESILNYLKDKNKKDNIYFKIGRDKNNNLIALYFNIDNFIEKGTEYIWLFTDWIFTGKTFLHMSFWNIDSKYNKHFRENVSHVKINEFRSFYPKMGHGSFILKNLDNIIKETNKLITINTEEVYPIKTITGMVVPMTNIISFEDLVNLYEKNGFQIIKEKRKNGSYKTIIIKAVLK